MFVKGIGHNIILWPIPFTNIDQYQCHLIELFLQHYLIIYHKIYSHSRVPAATVTMATSALVLTNACTITREYRCGEFTSRQPIVHVPPSSICTRPHLISFLPTSGHLIAPNLPSITEFGTVFKTHVYQKRTRDINELKHHLVDVWSDFRQTLIDGTIDEWRMRLKACVRMKGHHFEHVL